MDAVFFCLKVVESYIFPIQFFSYNKRYVDYIAYLCNNVHKFCINRSVCNGHLLCIANALWRNTMTKLRGAFTAMITPMFPDGSVDYDGFKKNVLFQLDGGLDGLLPLR